MVPLYAYQWSNIDARNIIFKGDERGGRSSEITFSQLEGQNCSVEVSAGQFDMVIQIF